MRYKLVIPKVLPDFMTGEELKLILRANDFSIPQIAYHPLPVDNTYPRGTKAYANANRLVAAQNKVIAAQFKLDMLNLENQLKGMFQIATYVVVGHGNDGTKIRDYRIVPDPAYKFSQCASRLTKLPSAEVIDFICFKYFG